MHSILYASANVGDRFAQFVANLKLTADQRRDGMTKAEGIVACLNEHYWNSSSTVANGLLVGSWGTGRSRDRTVFTTTLWFETSSGT